jgi:hypothetical protein
MLMAGECLISDGESVTKLIAPSMVKTVPGVKRAVYAITDIILITAHPNPTNEQDPDKLEEVLVIPEEFPKFLSRGELT